MAGTPCTAKRSYATEGEAIDQLVSCVQSNMAGAERRRERSVYHCQRCGGWHLTEVLQAQLPLDRARRALQARWNQFPSRSA